jgi:uncharacterized protein YuzE
MNIQYDKIADAVYIQLKKGKIQSTVEISDIVLHDLDNKGNVLGIELLNASKQLSSKELEKGVMNGVPLTIISGTPLAA